jgi:hypothetical protein
MAGAAPPTPLASAIRDVRVRVGSHDKFVDAPQGPLRHGGASRALVIKWEQGAVPSKRYREVLIAEGVDEDLFTRPAVELTPDGLAIMQEALANQRRMRKDLEALAQQVSGLVSDMTAVLQALGEEPGSERSLASVPNHVVRGVHIFPFCKSANCLGPSPLPLYPMAHLRYRRPT